MNTLYSQLHRAQRTEALKLVRQMYAKVPQFKQASRADAERSALRIIQREALQS